TIDLTLSAGSLSGVVIDNSITNIKAADMATARLKGRVTAATGDPEDLTGTQATTLLDTFTSALKGLAPASGGGTSNYLRADGTWQAPPALASGQAIMTAVETITALTWTTLANGPVLTLDAGTYLIRFSATLVVSPSSVGNGVNVRLWNDTDAAEVSDTRAFVFCDANSFFHASTGCEAIVTISATKTFKLQAQKFQSGGGTFQVTQAATSGTTRMTYLKLA
ncbi:MAG TPA: hypothetical protein VKD72_28085, partial [Gemmataceae bacterium]|nr:hypothetical protein [Gemmataceae bacterium]